MAAIRAAYDKDAAIAREQGRALPSATETLPRIKAVIASRVQGVRRES
jgi:hypothetical protein